MLVSLNCYDDMLFKFCFDFSYYSFCFVCYSLIYFGGSIAGFWGYYDF